MKIIVKDEALLNTAYALYNNEADTMQWIKTFTFDELVELWSYCVYSPCNLIGEAFDDEVYDALDELGYFKTKGQK